MSHLIACPECQKQLQVPEDLLGSTVQCPECQHTFTAQGTETISISSAPKKPSQLPVPTKRPASRDTHRADDEDDDSCKRRRSNDEDDDADYERPSRRRRSSARRRSEYGGDFMPHRGGMILAFGIIGLVSGLGIVFGPIAWIMGNADIREIQAGRMDPEGESMTQTGRILGMITTILSIVGIIAGLGFFAFVVGCGCCLPFMAAANNPNNPNFNNGRRR